MIESSTTLARVNFVYDFFSLRDGPLASKSHEGGVVVHGTCYASDHEGGVVVHYGIICIMSLVGYSALHGAMIVVLYAVITAAVVTKPSEKTKLLHILLNRISFLQILQYLHCL